MTDTTPPEPPLRRLLGSLLSLLHTRVELVGIELAEERERLMGILFLGLGAMLLTAVALLSLTALIVIVFWDTYRWHALAAVTGLYAVGGLACALMARRALRHAPSAFEATLSELEKDRAMFGGRPRDPRS